MPPCDDFYKFACGSFNKVMPIPRGQTNTDAFTDESQKINEVENNSILGRSELRKSSSVAIRRMKRAFDRCIRGGKLKLRSFFDEQKYLAQLRTQVLVEILRQKHEFVDNERFDMRLVGLFLPDVLSPTSSLVNDISKMSKDNLCTKKIMSSFPVPFLRLFVDKFNNKMKTAVQRNLLNSVVNTIDTSLKIEGDDARLMKKLKNTVVHLMRNFVYPNFILNNNLLNKVKKINWPISPFTINAEYRYTDNSLTVPAAFLGPTMFNLGVIPVLNYARAGWVVSHESSHLLASIFNVTEHFKSGTGCLIGQLKSIVHPQVKISYNQAGAEAIINEMLADVGAVNVSLLGLAKAKNSMRLPGKMSRYSTQQLYFISRAQILCEHGEDSFIRNSITDPQKVTQGHPNNYYRVILPSMNSPLFSQAFKCKPGSLMNPARKCQLW